MKKLPIYFILTMLFSLFVLYGCSYKAVFSTTMKKSTFDTIQKNRQAKSPDEIEIFNYGSTPKKPYVIIGTMEAPKVQWTALYTRADLIDALKKKAAEIGADAIINVRDQQNPTGGYNYNANTFAYFKNLYMWGDAIIYVSPQEKKRIEEQ